MNLPVPIPILLPRQQRLEIPGDFVHLPEARAQAERVPAAVARAVVVQKPAEAAHLGLGVDLRVRGLQPAGRVGMNVSCVPADLAISIALDEKMLAVIIKIQ